MAQGLGTEAAKLNAARLQSCVFELEVPDNRVEQDCVSLAGVKQTILTSEYLC